MLRSRDGYSNIDADDPASGGVWYRSSKFYAVAFIVLIVGALLGIGLGVGLGAKSGHSENYSINSTYYSNKVAQITSAALKNTRGYSRLSYFADSFGIREAGTPNLANMLNWAQQTMKSDKLLSNPQLQDVQLINMWTRGSIETLWMMTPLQNISLSVTALGSSVPTPEQGITGQVIVLNSLADAAVVGRESIEGKIVVWNKPWAGSYGATVDVRSSGASTAARYGAIASLTRSVTPFSLYSVHTGFNSYAANVSQIPAAAITVEDAELLQRMQDRGQLANVTLTLTLDCSINTTHPGHSSNIVAELTGSKKPKEIIVVGGHTDSWSRGAQDDGGGFSIAWEAANLLAQLKLKPRRTIRVVGWTAEEIGGAGSQAYAARYQDQMNATKMAIEIDLGVFAPVGFTFNGLAQNIPVLQSICDLMPAPFQLTVKAGGSGADTAPLVAAGVPAAGMQVEDSNTGPNYWWYHHTLADCTTAVSQDDYNQVLAVAASVLFVIADMPDNLARST